MTFAGIKACADLEIDGKAKTFPKITNRYLWAYMRYTDLRTDISQFRKDQIMNVLQRINPSVKNKIILSRDDVIGLMSANYTVSAGDGKRQ